MQSALTPTHDRRWITTNNKYCLHKFESKGKYSQGYNYSYHFIQCQAVSEADLELL